MKIEYNRINPKETVLLSLGFKYEKDKQGRPIKTICNLYRLQSHDDKDGVCIGSGMAVCHLGDQMMKAIGRKLALKRALIDGAHQASSGVLVDRAMRTSVWRGYMAQARV